MNEQDTERLKEGTMDNPMLTDVEIRTAIDKVLSTIPASAKADEYFKLRDRAIARAAARKVAEWLFSPCKEHHLNNSTPPLRIDCYICRKDMEEVGL